MNIYDKAHDLARALKASDEFKEYENWHKVILANEEKFDRVKNYRQKFIEFQMAHMGADKVDEDQLKNLEDLQKSLMLDSEIASFMQAEMKFATIFNDINDIINDAVKIDGK